MRLAYRGFTLIELMVVISIITLLSTVIIRALNGVREKAYDSAAYSTGLGMATDMLNCTTGGGTLSPPNSALTPTNILCSLGEKYGKWRTLPPKWEWYLGWPSQTLPNSDQLIYAEKPGNFNDPYPGMYCGIFPHPNFSDFCQPRTPAQCSARFPGGYPQYCITGNKALCSMASTYTCIRWSTATGEWVQK